MPWICSKHGVCLNQQRECEDCEHFSGDNRVYWTDDKDIISIVKDLQTEIESQREKNKQLSIQNASLKSTLYRVKPEARFIYE